MKNNKETMIVAAQDETHVYAGDTGFVVIKQVGSMDGDAVIFLDPQNVAAVIEALKEAVPQAIRYRTEWMQEDEQ